MPRTPTSEQAGIESSRRGVGPTATPMQRGVMTILFGGAGYLLNSAPIGLFNGTDVVLGGLASLALALRFGPLWGALGAGIAFLPTVFAWEHPWAWVLAVGEAVLVGRMRHDPDGRLRGTHLAYWVGVGVPMLGAHLLLQRGLPPQFIVLILLKFVLSAVVLLALARIAMSVPAVWGGPKTPEQQARGATLRDYLIGASAMAVAAPAIIGTLVITELIQARIIRSEARSVQALAEAVALSVGEVIKERQVNLVGIARHLGGGTAVDREMADALLRDFGDASGSFLTMLVADERGNLVAGYAEDSTALRMLLATGFTVGDRPYFRIPRTTGQPYVSDPFIGRGFGQDRIVAISAPIVGADGRFLGIVEGSISTMDLADFIGNVPPRHRVTIASQSRLIVTWTETEVPPLGSVERVLPPLLRSERFAPDDQQLRRVYVERRDDSSLRIGEQTRLVAVVPAGHRWRVVVSRSMADALASVRNLLQLATLGALAAFLLLRLLFARVLRDVLAPLDVLAGAVSPSRAGSTQLEPVSPRLSPSAPREILALARGFDAMQRALEIRFMELRDTIRERDESNSRLEQTMVALDELVKVRTRELEGALDEARRAGAAKTEFLAAMSHELRTPLNAIVGSIDVMREGVYGPLNDQQREALDQVERSAEHLLALISDILDMERIAAGRLVVKRERVDVRALVERVRGNIQPLAVGAALEFAVVLPSGVLWIDADALRLQQVLLNLLSNAVKFTPSGGRIQLTVRTGRTPGRVDAFEICDSGIGIPEHQRARIFEPFSQVESGHTRRYGGTGLGLSISRALCDAMGLRLEIERSGPDGTVFVVRV